MNTAVFHLSPLQFFEFAIREKLDRALEKIKRWINVFSATNAFETDILELFFNATTISLLADDTATTPATNLYVSLHTSDPGETGNQTTNECAYTSYARVAVARTSGGWTVSGNNCSNTAAITFPAATGGSETATHFGIGTGSSGTGYLMCSGALDSSLAISSGITPEFAIGACDINLD